MSKKVILLASVLKPITDTRMYEKFAGTLAAHYDVHVAGFDAVISPHPIHGVSFWPLFSFRRNSIRRLMVSVDIWKLARKIKPDVLVVHAVELLPVAFLLHLFFKVKLIYDVPENYARNILHQPVYPSFVKRPLAFFVRSLEWLSRVFVDMFILAERGYQDEFSFSKNKDAVLENKYAGPTPIEPKKYQNPPARFVVTGTLSETFGIREAVQFIIKLKEIGKPVEFHICGRAASEGVHQFLLESAKKYQFIALNINRLPIPHSQILETLSSADVALLCYPPNPSTRNCIPTKLWECMALGVPMLIQHNPLWEEVATPHGAAVFADFSKDDPLMIYQKICEHTFYPHGYVQSARWQEEGDKLLKLMDEMCNGQ